MQKLNNSDSGTPEINQQRYGDRQQYSLICQQTKMYAFRIFLKLIQSNFPTINVTTSLILKSGLEMQIFTTGKLALLFSLQVFLPVHFHSKMATYNSPV